MRPWVKATESSSFFINIFSNFTLHFTAVRWFRHFTSAPFANHKCRTRLPSSGNPAHFTSALTQVINFRAAHIQSVTLKLKQACSAVALPLQSLDASCFTLYIQKQAFQSFPLHQLTSAWQTQQCPRALWSSSRIWDRTSLPEEPVKHSKLAVQLPSAWQRAEQAFL